MLNLSLPNGAVTEDMADGSSYRYLLWRTWDAALPKLGFIMLNPSTADAQSNDPTIRRDIGFATDNGYGGLVVANLFAYRATDWRQAKYARKPICSGKGAFKNDQFIVSVLEQCEKVICAWGANAAFIDDRRAADVLALFARMGKTPYVLYPPNATSLLPRHPLYLSKLSTIEEYV